MDIRRYYISFHRSPVNPGVRFCTRQNDHDRRFKQQIKIRRSRKTKQRERERER